MGWCSLVSHALGLRGRSTERSDFSFAYGRVHVVHVHVVLVSADTHTAHSVHDRSNGTRPILGARDSAPSPPPHPGHDLPRVSRASLPAQTKTFTRHASQLHIPQTASRERRVAFEDDPAQPAARPSLRRAAGAGAWRSRLASLRATAGHGLMRARLRQPRRAVSMCHIDASTEDGPARRERVVRVCAGLVDPESSPRPCRSRRLFVAHR